ncbi:MAG: acyltransferase [Flexibacter sp. CG_4_10_14_3_um_filter_32_15]|nr:MAG: acyltransferase [Flexibacter sp. CG_4_10_14_3_um_filter_32_15]
MILALFRFLFRLRSWKIVRSQEVTQEILERCVLIASPHTTNWDAIYTIAWFDIAKINWRFTIKKEWIKPPFGKMLLNMGAIGIDRRPKIVGEERPSMVQAMANLFTENEKLAVVFTPEATRNKVTEWKMGFYYAAKLANVPIVLGYLDYQKREAGVTKFIIPSDDMEADLKEIMDFYKDKKGKYPEKFSVDLRYV